MLSRFLRHSEWPGDLPGLPGRPQLSRQRHRRANSLHRGALCTGRRSGRLHSVSPRRLLPPSPLPAPSLRQRHLRQRDRFDGLPHLRGGQAVSDDGRLRSLPPGQLQRRGPARLLALRGGHLQPPGGELLHPLPRRLLLLISLGRAVALPTGPRVCGRRRRLRRMCCRLPVPKQQ